MVGLTAWVPARLSFEKATCKEIYFWRTDRGAAYDVTPLKLSCERQLSRSTLTPFGHLRKIEYNTFRCFHDANCVPCCSTDITRTRVFNVTGKEDLIYDALKNVSHLKVYRKADIPERYHYRNSPRIPAIVIEAEEGWVICGKQSPRSCFSRKGE